MISASIVTHGHGKLALRLIGQLLTCPEISQIILTKNIPEYINLPISNKILLIENSSPRGFGANHNYAFNLSSGKFFCVLNPDIKLLDNPFNVLVQSLINNGISIISPIILNKNMEVEDHARKFPTICTLFKKLLFGSQGRTVGHLKGSIYYSEWIAGMFLLFKKDTYIFLGGFDEKYYLYYEDVDICVRAWRESLRVGVETRVSAIHFARRSSRKNLIYASMHAKSMMRYLVKQSLCLPKLLKTK